MKQSLFIINNTELKTKLKTDIFKVILGVKTTTATEYLKVWSTKGVTQNGKPFKKCTKSELVTEMDYVLNLIIYGNNKGVEGYERLIEKKLIDLYKREKGIKYYEYVYLKHFKPYHEKNIGYIYKFFKNIFYYENLSTSELIEKFFDKIAMALDVALDDLIEKFDDINGELETI